ncbi:MAG: ATP-binding protein [Candidatus Pacebacteria bacterium]|nr:ATP-binding protein [Candidatus Paceibacterota bacterium]
MFNKPISQLTEDDLQSLIDNKERESSILEYKQEISGTDHEKKEISKDVSAMANTEGGYLVIGIKEASGQADAIIGTPKTIGKQPVEAWIENVLIANVRPKIAITPKVITLASSSDRVVIVLHIPQSPKRPHMVIAEGRNAYYARHNYQANYADEHEVRSMFLESKSLGDEMKSFLISRNLNDPLSDNFAITPLSKRLSKSLREMRELPDNFNGNPFILFAACPRYLEERVDIASSDLRDWLNLKNQVNLFELNIDFLNHNKVVSVDSIRSVQEVQSEKGTDKLLYNYVELFRNGYIEGGISSEIMWSHEKLGLMFQLAYFTAALWLFMKFIRDLYEHIEYLEEINLTIAIVDVENVVLHGFGKKDEKTTWAQPYNMFHFDNLPICKQKNVKIERSFIASDLNDENIEKIVKEVSKRVSNAFGESISKCFDDSGNFDVNQIRGFRNVY